MSETIHDFKAKTNAGKELSFGELKGKTLLIVNTASKCGFTPQYKGLEDLYKTYKDKGLVVIGFPCDQFAHQEPGDDAAIQEFCQVNFGVTFPLMSKIDVNGPDTHPVFNFLKKQAPGAIGEGVKWNFTKFLVSPDGSTVRRFAPTTEPAALVKDIEKVLP